jgi:4a-hydroxytetrahydrobiopterin dehydratase
MSRDGVVKLSSEEIQHLLASLENWSLVDGKLHRELVFESFIEAFAFMTKLAIVAERINHHPEWSNVYNRVRIALVTHDENGITNLDVELARAVEHYYGTSR